MKTEFLNSVKKQFEYYKSVGEKEWRKRDLEFESVIEN